MPPFATITRFALALAACAAGAAEARQGDLPYTLSPAARDAVELPALVLPAIDAAALRAAGTARNGDPFAARDKRLAIAIGTDVSIDPASDGAWQRLADGSSLWRIRVEVPGATDLHLGFARQQLPAGARLWAIAEDGYYEGPYTAADRGPLWLPMLPGGGATIELQMPPGLAYEAGMLSLDHVDAGFRDLFGRSIQAAGDSGACNVNVACPLGVPYADETRALAYYEFRGDDAITYICTGTLLNTVPADRKGYVLTAAHCLATAAEAATMRLYWNYRSNACATTSGFSLAQNQTGATLRATRADVDFSLVELATPPLAAWNLFHAGWDASGVAPSASIGLHHPSGDVAKVTASGVAPTTYPNCIGTGGSSTNTHWLAGPYTQGTTEGGSSGSGLWIPANDPGGRGKRLIGMLSGGNAACSIGDPSRPDNGYDCYGKFSAAWDGPNPAARLRDWLDPAGAGTRIVAGIDNVTTGPGPVGGLATPIAARRHAAANRASESPRHPRPRPFDPDTRRRP